MENKPTTEAMKAAAEVMSAFYLYVAYSDDNSVTHTLARAMDAFADAARKDEREACARLTECDSGRDCKCKLNDAADAIRQRGAK